jgi:hypothetical protein
MARKHIWDSERRKGHTLLEMLVVMVLFIIAGMLTFDLLKYGLRTFQTANSRLDYHRKVFKVLADIDRDMEHTTIESLSFTYPAAAPTQGNLAISFLSPLDGNGTYITGTDGGPVYQAFIIYYFHKNSSSSDSPGTLKKVRVNLVTPTDKPTALTEDEVIDYISRGNPKIVLKDTEYFQVLESQSDTVLTKAENPFRISLKVWVTDKERYDASSKLVKTFRLNK